MFKEIIIAIQSYVEAHRFIVKHKLWHWILIPGLLYAILFGVGIYFFWISSDKAIHLFLEYSGLDKWVRNDAAGWLKVLFVFTSVLVNILMLLLYFSLFKYLFLIIGSPIFAYLSEKTEATIEGKEFPFNFKQLLHDIARGVKLALRNTLWQTVYTVSILILSFIPLVGWFTPFLALLIECYYFGFSMLDYSCERHKLSTSESIAFIGKHKGLAIGNGIIFYMMHMLVFVGWLLAPTYAVVAATLSLYKTNKLKL
ncbi:MAG: EI24 domain-containing protein [Ferruginibacter sp.]